MSGEHVEKCNGCGEMIDPDVCWCGESINHGHGNHSIAPMGCNCYRDLDADADYASAPHPSAHHERAEDFNVGFYIDQD